MTRIKNTLEMRGMLREELISYFIEIGGKLDENGIYRGVKWEVFIDKQVSCSMGSLSLPSTEVTFNVEEDFYEEMLSKFRLKFLRGGA